MTNNLQNSATVTVATDLVMSVLKNMAGTTIDGNLLKGHSQRVAIKARSVLDKKEVIR